MALSPGTRLGPYEILASLGAGGMGEVWRARDTRLDRDVAIKVLPEERFDDRESKGRFEREAKALAALNHPNIASIHSFEEVSGRRLLVQELLEGASLRETLRAGPLPPRKAIQYGVEIAEGLAAAHAKGIVHRDLKPENLFVTEDGRIKILDFGLAREVAVPSGVDTESPTDMRDTEPGVVMGTVGYLAPEQVRGEAADARSDIFAFGCVLYEMLAGRRAFAARTPADTMAAILREDPAPFAVSGREIVPALRTIVRRCLEKRPSDRFSSAHDLSIALQAFSGGEEAAPYALAAVPSWLARHRAVTLGFLAAAVVAVAGALWWRSRSAKPPPALDPKRVAVAAFEDRTGDPAAARVAVLVAERITTGLSRVGGITVAADPALPAGAKAAAAAGGGVDALRPLAARTGAGLVIAGAVYASGGDVELQARLVAPGEGRVIYAVEPARGPLSSPDAVIELVRQRVLGAVAAETEEWFWDPSLMRPPTFEAFQELVRAREIFNQDIPGSIRHAQRAVELDPGCSFARFALSTFLANGGAYAESEKELAETESLRGGMTPLERLMLAYKTALLAAHYAESLAAIRKMSELAPRLLWIRHNRADIEVALNMPRAAVTTLSNTNFKGWGGLGGGGPLLTRTIALHLLGEYEAQLSSAREGRARVPGDLRFAGEEAAALAALGRTDEVEKTIEGAVGVPASAGSPGGLMLQTAAELSAHAHPDAAAPMRAKALDWYRTRPLSEAAKEPIRRGLGAALLRTGRVDEASAIFADLAREHPDDISYRGWLGVLAALRGDAAGAERISEELRRVDRPYLFGEHHYERARIAARLGKQEDAVRLLQQAFSEGFPFSLSFHRDPDLEPLHGFPPFDELMKPKG